MKILFSVEHYYPVVGPVVGGGERSIKTLAGLLSKNHKVEILCAGTKNKEIQEGEVEVHIRKDKKTIPKWMPKLYWLSLLYHQNRWSNILKNFIKNNRPDIILTQANFSPPTVETAVSEGIPTILFIRSYGHFCPIWFLEKDPFHCNKSCWYCVSLLSKLQYPIIKRLLGRHKKAFRNASLVIANSKYVSEVTKTFYGVNAEVLYPNIDLTMYKTKIKSKRYILYVGVGTTKHKGIDLLLEIANQMANEEFLVLGMHPRASLLRVLLRKKLEKSTNIRCISWVDDVREILSETKLLLMPRLWPEPFGRVVVEAGINGIPTVSSKVGGLVESVGNGGIFIDDYRSVDKWIKGVNRVLDDEALYSKLSQNAENHAKQFDLDKTYLDFKKIVNKRLNINL